MHRAKCNEKGVIRAIMICIRLRAFVILCLQLHCTEKVVQLRSSTAITVPSLFGEFYEIFHMKTRKHVRSSTSWYGAVFFGYFVLIFVYARNGSFCHACHGGALEMAVVLQHHGIEFRLATQCHTWK